jgi:two-component system, response regulator PdtaR
MVPAEVVALREPVLLVVEDEVLIRLSTSDFLRNEGFTVLEAGSGREALTLLKVRSDVSVVVTDIHMAGALEGLDLIRELRKSFPAVKIVTASAYQITEAVESSTHQAIFVGPPFVCHQIAARTLMELGGSKTVNGHDKRGPPFRNCRSRKGNYSCP